MKLNVNLYDKDDIQKNVLLDNILKNNPIIFVIPNGTSGAEYVFDAVDISEGMLKSTYLLEELDLLKVISFLSTFDLENTKALMMVPADVPKEQTISFSENVINWVKELRG